MRSASAPSRLRLASLALLCASCGALPSGDDAAAPPDPFAADPWFLDDLLAHDGSRDGTLGSVGGRLFADRLEPAPGFHGLFHYLHHSDRLRDPVHLAFSDRDGPVLPTALRETWRPSFHETRFRLGVLDVVERKFIRDDDVMVSVLRFDNTTEEPRLLSLRVGSAFARTPAYSPEAFVPLDLRLFANLAAEAAGLSHGAGRVDEGGVPFVRIDPATNGGRSVVALRGREPDGGPAGGQPALPRTVEIPVNDWGRRLHLLGQVGLADAPPPPGTVVARYTLFPTDGAPQLRELRFGESAGLASGEEPRPALRAVAGRFVLTIPLNPTRKLAFLRFESAGAGFSPLLDAATLERDAAVDAAEFLSGSESFFGVDVSSALAADVRPATTRRAPLRIRSWERSEALLEGDVQVEPGGSAEVRVAHAFAEDPLGAAARARDVLAATDPLGEHRDAWNGWFARNCPRFASGDPLLDKLWWYRWFVVRHNLARPAAGRLPATVFYEGRHGPWYPKLISYSSPHIVAEARWLADPRYARNQIRAHLATADSRGFIQSARTDWTGAFYTHWLAVACRELDDVHPDDDFLREVLPGLERDLLGTLAVFDGNGNDLPVPENVYETGMEWQPSFFYFHGYDNTKPIERLERPDFASYCFGNAQALAHLWRRLGDEPRAAAMDELAGRLRAAVLERMWNAELALFLPAREHDGTQALCPEIVDFYPWAFGLPPDDMEYARAFSRLLSPTAFETPVPFASCSREVPVFSPSFRNWPGPGGHVENCMWNGPVWPHANSLIANALGRTLLESSAHDLTPADLREFLLAYARLHFEDGDLGRPMLRETADAETGEQWGCPDYFHSTWIDLVFRYADLVGWPQPTPPAAVTAEGL